MKMAIWSNRVLELERHIWRSAEEEKKEGEEDFGSIYLSVFLINYFRSQKD
jgi:hypothetical protein